MGVTTTTTALRNRQDADLRKNTRREATRGRTNSLRLQHPEGVHSSPCSPSPWWYHRAIAQGPCFQVQLRQDDLPKVLRPSPSPCYQLQKEEVRSHQPTPTKEEAEVNGSHIWRLEALEDGKMVKESVFRELASCIILTIA